MPSAAAAPRAVSGRRDAMARTSACRACRIAGMTFFTAMRAAPSTPQRTLSGMVPTS